MPTTGFVPAVKKRKHRIKSLQTATAVSDQTEALAIDSASMLKRKSLLNDKLELNSELSLFDHKADPTRAMMSREISTTPSVNFTTQTAFRTIAN